MNRYQTLAIILRRVNYGEADRIITCLSSTHGKISLLARAVRRPKSKLAGGIELLSVCELTVLEGKGQLDHLISARTKQTFTRIVREYEVVRVAYRALKLINDTIEDGTGMEYFELLKDTLSVLNDPNIPLTVSDAWFSLHFLQIRGNSPNLTHDVEGKELKGELRYLFDSSEGAFQVNPQGTFDAQAIKAWRVLSTCTKEQLKTISGLDRAIDGHVEELERFVDFVS